MWLEGRFASEYVTLIRDPVYYGRGVTRGGGRPVLLIPGFLAGDQTLLTMQAWLRRMDYKPELSGIRFNVRYSEVTVESVLERLYVHQKRSKQKVALIGHSRGGLLAKVLADRNPELVSQVIALGSPLNEALDVHPLTMAAVRAARLYHRLPFGNQADSEAAFVGQLAPPPPAPPPPLPPPPARAFTWTPCIPPACAGCEVGDGGRGCRRAGGRADEGGAGRAGVPGGGGWSGGGRVAAWRHAGA